MNYEDEDICALVCKLPEWIAIRLIDYWLVHFGDLLDGESELGRTLEQFRFVVGSVIKHLTTPSEYGLEEVSEFSHEELESFPSFEHISDDTIYTVCHKIHQINADITNIEFIYYLLSKAIYNSRIKIFGGVFPFSFDDAGLCLSGVENKAGFWLAHFSAFNPNWCANNPSLDNYKVFESLDGKVFQGTYDFESGQITEGRTNQRAIRRLNAYRAAFESIKGERVDELAKAWWAFFIASQAIAFGGFGLSAAQIAGVVDVASSLLPDEAVQKALTFALSVTKNHSPSLQFRITKSLVSGILERSSGLTKSDVISLSISKERAAAYLEKTVGPETWSALGEQSRRDLIEGEQLWGMSALEMGAGRRDWGALIALYFRVIEAEVREHIGPLVNRLQKAGICQVKEPTLDGCLKAIRDAGKVMKESGGLKSSERDRPRLHKLHAFFVDQYSFLEVYRNRAAHGNREEPITDQEFTRLRTAMYAGGLFKVVIDSRSE